MGKGSHAPRRNRGVKGKAEKGLKRKVSPNDPVYGEKRERQNYWEGRRVSARRGERRPGKDNDGLRGIDADDALQRERRRK